MRRKYVNLGCEFPKPLIFNSINQTSRNVFKIKYFGYIQGNCTSLSLFIEPTNVVFFKYVEFRYTFYLEIDNPVFIIIILFYL